MDELAQKLKENCLAKRYFLPYDPTKLPPLRSVIAPEWRSGIGGIPIEPLPELDAEQEFLRYRTSQYQSTPYVETTEEQPLEEKTVAEDSQKRALLIICKNLNKYLFNGIEETIIIKDTTVIIDTIRCHPELGFLYLKRCNSEKALKYNPYYFKVCNYFHLKSSKYCTISPLGFAEFSSEEYNYATLNTFEREYRIYRELVKMDFFSKYYLWKPFTTWLTKTRKLMWIYLRQKMSAILLFTKHPHYRDNETRNETEADQIHEETLSTIKTG